MRLAFSTPSITTPSITAPSITAPSITALSITALSITTLGRTTSARRASALTTAGLAFGLALGLAGCGDDGGGGNGIDASPAIDAPSADATPMPLPDAMQSTQGLGLTCTGAGQGDCPSGFECLTLQGGTVSWCSRRCQDPTDLICADGYPGPGVASCFLAIDENNDGTPDFNACAIICSDPPGAPDICPTCDGSCPGALQCTAPVMDQNMNVIANSCQ